MYFSKDMDVSEVELLVWSITRRQRIMVMVLDCFKQ